MHIRWLVALTLGVALASGIAIYLLNPEKLSALGGILSGAGSILAVIWFSASLRYQSRQLEEQRKQFQLYAEQVVESSRRDALLVVQGVLGRAEADAIKFHGDGVTSALGLAGRYLSVVAGLKAIIECGDPEIVVTLYTQWAKTEHAASMFMAGVKAAAEIYCRSMRISQFDYSKPAEYFYLEYGKHFNQIAYFSSVAQAASTLSEVMVGFIQDRKAARLAFEIAVAETVPQTQNLWKTESKLEELRSSGGPVPAIAARAS